MASTLCRSCGNPLNNTFIDLGMSPLSNAYIKEEDIEKAEKFYPLHAYVCDKCFLVQLDKFETPEQIFSDYAYFSSYSDSWLQHANNYADMIIDRFQFGKESRVIEVASNDGYLLQFFKKKNIPILGIEPAANVAEVAEANGIPTLVEFLGVECATKLKEKGVKADLLIGNNVLAHVPDINDFVEGLKILLSNQGIITMEFPHLLNLIKLNQFDTIYHEHFSYLSFIAVKTIFNKHGLKLFDVERLSTHGGSLRIYACHSNYNRAISDNVSILIQEERKEGLLSINTYESFSEKVKENKRKLLDFMIYAKRQGKTIVGYGAPAKGNTLLNYCGIRSDFIDYTVDRNPYKQGRYLPGVHLKIKAPEIIIETKPDYILVLPWNLKDEIISQLSYVREWGAKFIIPIPDVEVL